MKLSCFICCALLHFIRSEDTSSNQSEVGCGSNEERKWFVSLGVNDSSKFVHVCGGVFIGPQWILTAANCFEHDESEDDILLWRAGNEASIKEFNKASIVKKIIKPKMRNEDEYGNDIALVMIENKLTSPSIICLPGDDEISSDEQLKLDGLGQKEIKVSLLDNSQCMSKYLNGNKKNLEKDKNQLKEMICAKQGENCENHAGGPLIRHNKGVWEAVAVFSIAISCGQESLFTPVHPFIEWIKSNMST